jgi:hypothetical protein
MRTTHLRQIQRTRINTYKYAIYNISPSGTILFPVDGGKERPLSFFHDRAVA